MKVNYVNKALGYYCSAVHSFEEETNAQLLTQNVKTVLHIMSPEQRMKEESWVAL